MRKKNELQHRVLNAVCDNGTNLWDLNYIESEYDITIIMKELQKIIKETEKDDSLTTTEELEQKMDSIRTLQNLVDFYESEIDLDIEFNLTSNFMQVFSNLINQRIAWINTTDSNKTEIASQILLHIQYNSFTLSCKQNISNELKQVTNRNIIVNTYHTNFSQQLVFEANSSSIVIPKGLDLNELNKCNNSAFGALINQLHSYLLPENDGKQLINSKILAFSVTNDSQTNQINDGVRIRLEKNILIFIIISAFNSKKYHKNESRTITYL